MRTFTTLVLAAMLLIVAAPAFAITYGNPDDGLHPYVGAMVDWTSD